MLGFFFNLYWISYCDLSSVINHVSTEATRNEEIENNVGFDQPGPKKLCDNAYKLN